MYVLVRNIICQVLVMGEDCSRQQQTKQTRSQIHPPCGYTALCIVKMLESLCELKTIKQPRKQGQVSQVLWWPGVLDPPVLLPWAGICPLPLAAMSLPIAPLLSFSVSSG